MDMKSKILTYIEENKENLLSTYSLTSIALFGSISTDNYDDKSDIDLLVEFKPNTLELRKVKGNLKKEFKSVFGRDVDICSKKYIKPYFKEVILSQAIYV